MRADARPRYGTGVTQRRWTLRGADSEIAILVITGNQLRLDALAIEVASHGYYTFVAIPEAVAALVRVTKFDLVIVISDVTTADRVRLAQLRPPIDARFLTLDAPMEPTIAELIRARLAR